MPLPDWLSGAPARDGMIELSPSRAYLHDEAAYDARYDSDPDNLEPGRGVCALVRRFEGDTSLPALEVGCGTGLASLGLVERSPCPLTILTDPSPAFLRITRDKIVRRGLAGSPVAYAILSGDELRRLPDASLSLIVVRSTLHHVLDADAFIAEAARALAPAGLLLMQEPCMEGYVLMGAMVQFLPALAAGAGRPLTGEQETTVTLFRDTMEFYARRDVDKSRAEDKHLFRPDELITVAARAGLRMEFLPNTTFEEQAPNPTADPTRNAFARFFRDYAQYCMSWPADLLARFDEHLAPYVAITARASGGGGGPYLHGLFVAKRVSR